MKSEARQVLILHNDPEWRTFWQYALEDVDHHPTLSDHLPDKQDLRELGCYDLVIMSLPIALAGLEQLLERPRHNLVIIIPLEGFASSREWRVYKLERVGAAVVDMPASESALTEFVQQYQELSAP